ncbi:MAG: hypothetical protein EOO77_01830 [Oxalobacteraceae bacterium]|nr:MAG: hypothetical protein EOO77_01830 [Oxalobacteraceae bacterium]
MPWYAHFRWPWELCDALFARQVPLIDHATSVELILAEFGPREARRYLLEHMVNEERFVRAMEGSDRPLEPDEACADPFRKLANIAQLCHLV